MNVKILKIKETLNIKLKGIADGVVDSVKQFKEVSINPDDFHGIVPKLVVKEGDEVERGQELFYSKYDERLKIVSPVSGNVVKIVRGEKRKVEKIIISVNVTIKAKKFADIDIQDNNSGEKIKNRLLESGLWTFIKQRPYDVIANPDKKPRDIFISVYNTNPLSPQYEISINRDLEYFQIGIDILNKLTEGKINLGVDASVPSSPFRNIKGVDIYEVQGKHPAGNVGVHINKINPINKGDIVWTLNPHEVVIIGKLFKNGEVDMSRIISVSGEGVNRPRYISVVSGIKLSEVLDNEQGLKKDREYRVISGSPLTGRNEGIDGYLGYYHDQVSVLPEGRKPRFFGWILPIMNKISYSKALLFSWMLPNKEYSLDTNTNGNLRSFVVTGDYEKVFPFDIYPMQLMKACLAEDIENMEALGIYEVSPEDFAVTEFICPSKIGHQEIIRKGLDLMIKELGQ